MTAHTKVDAVELGLDVPSGVNLEIFELGDDYLTFDISVDPPYRNEGRARAALSDLVDAADELGMHIALLASPDDPDMTQATLMRFYRSLGFEPIGYHGYMVRLTERH